MMKVTALNVVNLSEDKLYLILETLSEKDPSYILADAEIDRRIEVRRIAEKRSQDKKLEAIQISQEVEHLFSQLNDGKIKILISKLGDEFIDDYIVNEETLTITSKVFNTFGQPSFWTLSSLVEQQRKYRDLLYYRIYNKFMRDPTHNDLEFLKKILGE